MEVLHSECVNGWNHGLCPNPQEGPKLIGIQRDRLNTLKSGIEPLPTLISDTTDLSRIEARQIDGDAEEFDLSDLIHAILSATGIKARKEDPSAQYQEYSISARTVKGNSRKVQRMLLNVLDNAVKFTYKGCVIFRLDCARLPVAGERDAGLSFQGVEPIEAGRFSAACHALVQPASRFA